MGLGQTLIWGAQGAVFLCWAFVMFRSLFRLRRDLVDRAGASGFHAPSPAETLRSFGGFLTEPRHARDRRLLAFLTVLLFALTAGHALVGPGAG